MPKRDYFWTFWEVTEGLYLEMESEIRRQAHCWLFVACASVFA